MVANGTARLPLDQVEAYSRALEIDAADLMVMAARQYFDDKLFDLVVSARKRERQSRLNRASASATAILAVAGATKESIFAIHSDTGSASGALEEALGHFDRLIEEVKLLLADIENVRRD
jgi:uncharacterized protein (UPF0335 family)